MTESLLTNQSSSAGGSQRARSPDGFCVHELFEAQVDRTPDNIALVFGDKALSYRELNLRADVIAHHLRERGVQPEIPVAVCMGRSLESVIAVLAVLKAGGVFVPLDTDWPTDRRQFVLQETAAAMVLTQTEFADRLPKCSAAVHCLDRLDVPAMPWPSATTSCVNDLSTPTADNLCAIYFTSGSSGVPKGVLVPHRVSARILWGQKHAIALGPSDRRLLTSSIGYASFLGELCAPLFVGATVVLAAAGTYQDVEFLLRTIEAHRITVIGLVPSVLRQLLHRIQAEGPLRCASLRHIVSHGEALSPELQRLLQTHLQADLHKFYGLTEAPVVTYWHCRNGEDSNRTTIGRPTDMEVYLLDPTGRLVATGMPGEMYVGGPGMARGYLNRPDLTAERFIPNPFSPDPGSQLFRTGDLGRCLPDGVIEFLGRIDDQIKLNGVRIEVAEIEAALAQHPDVEQAVVALEEPRPGWKRLAAWVEGKPGSAVARNSLRRFLSEKLPRPMVPAVYYVLDVLPRTASGKVDRGATAQLIPEDMTPEKAFVPPRTATEKALAEIWAEVLGSTEIGIADDFFAAGGDSLLAFRLLSRIEQSFGSRFPIAAILEASTIEQLASLLENRPMDPSVSGVGGDGKRPLFCVNYGLNLSRHLGSDRPVYELFTERENVSKLSRIETLAASSIEKVRAIQPEGPYFLSGYAACGMVAYEMAQQLRAQGEEVAFLGIVDTYRFAPPIRKHVQRIAQHAKTILRTDPARWAEYFRGRMKAVCVRMNRRAPHEESASELPVWELVARVQPAYRARPYRGRVTLFLPQDIPPAQFREMERSWTRRDSVSQIDVIAVPGSHYTVVEEPCVQALAAHIKERLDKEEQRLPVLKSPSRDAARGRSVS